jgi:hypothetical protein
MRYFLALVLAFCFGPTALVQASLGYEKGDVIKKDGSHHALYTGYAGDFYTFPVSVGGLPAHTVSWMGNGGVHHDTVQVWSLGSIASTSAGAGIGGMTEFERTKLIQFSEEIEDLDGNGIGSPYNNIIDVIPNFGSTNPPEGSGYSLLDVQGNLKKQDIQGIRHDGWLILVHRLATERNVYVGKDIVTFDGIRALNDKEVDGSLLALGAALDSMAIVVDALTIYMDPVGWAYDYIRGPFCDGVAEWAYDSYVDSLSLEEIKSRLPDDDTTPPVGQWGSRGPWTRG